METRRSLVLLLEQLLVMTILCSTATPMHIVMFQKMPEFRTPVEHQEVLVVTSPDVRVSTGSQDQNNAVKLWFSRFPPFIERIVQFIQNRFSTYNYVGTYPQVIYEEPYSSTTTTTSTTTVTTTTSLPTTTLNTEESDEQTLDGQDSNSDNEPNAT